MKGEQSWLVNEYENLFYKFYEKICSYVRKVNIYKTYRICNSKMSPRNHVYFDPGAADVGEHHLGFRPSGARPCSSSKPEYRSEEPTLTSVERGLARIVQVDLWKEADKGSKVSFYLSLLSQFDIALPVVYNSEEPVVLASYGEPCRKTGRRCSITAASLTALLAGYIRKWDEGGGADLFDDQDSEIEAQVQRTKDLLGAYRSKSEPIRMRIRAPNARRQFREQETASLQQFGYSPKCR